MPPHRLAENRVEFVARIAADVVVCVHDTLGGREA